MRDNFPAPTSPAASASPKYLQPAATPARARRLLPRPAPLLAVLLSASGGIVSSAPAWAQGAPVVRAGASEPQKSAMRVGSSFKIDMPTGPGVSCRVVGGSGVRVRPLSSEKKWLVEGVRDGVAHVDVTDANGAVTSYLVSVGTGVALAVAQPDATTWGSVGAPSPDSADLLPVLSSSRGASLPAGLNAPPAPQEGPSLSPDFPVPGVRLPAFPRPTVQQQLQVAPARGEGRTIRVKTGLARFLSFRQNILSVYFSNTQAMDARALTARAVAITGSAPGRSTLAINVAQSPTDTVGRFEIFNIEVEAATPSTTSTLSAGTTEAAIRAAIADPRIGVNVIQGPNGTLTARLSGTLYNAAEKTAAESTAALFAPVISSLYLDPFAPTLNQLLNPITPISGEGIAQIKLRQITGNDSIELISLPGGLAVKATVDSPEDAEALLGLLPTLNTRVLPFIVVRGPGSSGSVDAAGAPIPSPSSNSDAGGGGKYYGANRPILEGENLEITRRLQEVTGIRTVSVVRTAQNALALYGTVRNRNEYDTVKRYAVLLPLFGSGVSAVTQSRGISSGGGFLPAPGQSIGGAAGAASGAGAVRAGGLAAPQFSPALESNPGDPFFQSQAQVAGGGATGAGGAGAGTGAVAPATTGGAGGTATGAGSGTGAVAPSATGTGVTGAGNLDTGGFGAGNFGTGFVPGFGGFGGGTGGGTSSTQIQGNPASGLGLSSSPGGLTNGISAAQQPNAGYRQDVNIQSFVRILDPNGQSVRRVTVESNIVEISRTSLRNLGVEAGSAALLSESVTPGTAATAATITINPATGQQTIIPGTPGTASVTTRTLDPTLRPGVAVLGNGFLGLQGLRNIDPLRFRLNALYQNGNARILSQPNISSTEGADAQIVIGGERPVPSSVATGQAVGQSIVFRRFGIILTMRPTVLDDDTIILQIRADVTELASEYGISLNGALIPGERVRSVNTTITVRPGDTFVLGGLITNDRRQQTSRIPILSSLPLIGSLFKSKRFENNESELAIFMTPRIDRIPVSTNGQEAVSRIQALPPLPDSATGATAFGSLGTATTP